MGIKVIDWVCYDVKNEDAPIGGLGGWFNANNIHDKENPTNMIWEDYINAFEDNSKPYLEALKKAILDNHLDITGRDHQNGNAPMFSDETVGRFSYRAWGDLMAAIHSTKENPIDYMQYYM